MIRKASFVSALMLLAVSSWGQMGGKPGPEVKKLDYFVGTWTTEGTVQQGPWGAGGKFSSTATSEWMPGEFFVVGHGDFKMPPEIGGDGKETAVMGYDTTQNVYTRDGFNSQGQHESSKGTVTGDTWTWTSEANYGGTEVKQRFTTKTLSPTSYTVKFEVSIDGTNWITFMDGKATKK
jgi:Protein of unknown function (DUF1579)